jgi:hypothetical protein
MNLNIGKDFSEDPSGRFYTDGPGSGEEFREEYLKKAIHELAAGEKLVIILDDGVDGYGSSFLSEGFAGLVRYGYITSADLLAKLEFSYTDSDYEFFKSRIIEYIKETEYDNEKYVPTRK